VSSGAEQPRLDPTGCSGTSQEANGEESHADPGSGRLHRAGNGTQALGTRRRPHPIPTPNGDHRSGQARLRNVEHGVNSAPRTLETLSRQPATAGPVIPAIGIAHTVAVPQPDGIPCGVTTAPVTRTAERTIEVTSTVPDPIELLSNGLEEQFQRNTDQLAELTLRSRQPDRGGYDHGTLAALIASARQAVSDTAQALRRMAEGSYGTCARCTADIPLQRLEILPHARFCVPCQRRQTG
jgi:DnaK suppressor protein